MPEALNQTEENTRGRSEEVLRRRLLPLPLQHQGAGPAPRHGALPRVRGPGHGAGAAEALRLLRGAAGALIFIIVSSIAKYIDFPCVKAGSRFETHPSFTRNACRGWVTARDDSDDRF